MVYAAEERSAQPTAPRRYRSRLPSRITITNMKEKTLSYRPVAKTMMEMNATSATAWRKTAYGGRSTLPHAAYRRSSQP